VTFIKIALSGLFLLFNVLPYTFAASPLQQEIKQQIYADLYQTHPEAIINIAFNPSNTHKKDQKCSNFELPSIRKVPTGGRISVRLTCKHPKWSTYISLKISISYSIAIAKMHILKGETLNINNTHFIQGDITKFSRPYFLDPSSVFGKVAKRAIKKDKAINPYMLDLPTLISKGDSVIIRAGANGFSISTLGTALQNGKKGRQIRIKNNRSGKIIKAYVTARGTVSTNPE